MSASVDRPRSNLVPAQAAAAYDVVARREALPVNTPTSVLEACRSVVAATLFYGTDLYHYVCKVHGKYGGEIRVRGIAVHIPTVASAELAAALVTTALEARRPASFRDHNRTRRLRAGVPQARRRRGPREAGVPRPEPGPLGACRARPRDQGPVQGPRRVRRRRIRQEKAQQARAEGRARPASVDHLTASRRS